MHSCHFHSYGMSLIAGLATQVFPPVVFAAAAVSKICFRHSANTSFLLMAQSCSVDNPANFGTTEWGSDLTTRNHV